MTNRRTVGRVLTALLLVLLTGCAGVPGSGPAEVVTKVTVPGRGDGGQAGPAPGSQPDQIVQGFIEASGQRSTDTGSGGPFAAARQYLTPRAQGGWQTTAGQVVVIEDNFGSDIDRSTTGLVTVTGQTFGTLDADRVFHPGGGSYTRKLELEKVDGQWRIADPPNELLIRKSDFTATYRPRTMYFLDPTGTVLVPDLRYLPLSGSAQSQATRVLTLLLGGPRGVLTGVAQNRLAGGALRSNLSISDGITKVDLTSIKPVNAAARQALAAQVVFSLNANPDQVAISLEGVQLDEQQFYTQSMLSRFDPDNTPGTQTLNSKPWYVTDEGRIAGLAGDPVMWGRLGDGSLRVTAAAMSKATGALAAVTRTEDGKSDLVIGRPLEYQQPSPQLKADTLSTPTFNRSGDQVWVVQNGGSANPEIYQVSATAGGNTASRARIGTKALEGKGAITDVELSPDGLRVAVVAGGRLYLGAVAPAETDSVPTGSGTPTAGEGKVVASIVNPVELRSDLTEVGAVAFNRSTELIVASKDGEVIRSVRRVLIDGSDKRQITTAGLTADVDAVAVSGEDMYVQMSTRVLHLVGSWRDGVWQNPEKVTTGAELAGSHPFFPN